MLGCQLGVGAYRALVEKGLNGVMVSVSGQLQLHYVPFEELVDPSTLVTVVRYIEPDSDFQKLTRFLETYVNEEELDAAADCVASSLVGSASARIKLARPGVPFDAGRRLRHLAARCLRAWDRHSRAIRSARAVALKIASLMWWLLRP